MIGEGHEPAAAYGPCKAERQDGKQGSEAYRGFHEVYAQDEVADVAAKEEQVAVYAKARD